MSITKPFETLWQKALSYASFRAFVRVLRIAVAAGVASFLASLVPGLQNEPEVMSVPVLAYVLLVIDKYLRDRKIY